MPSLFTPAVLRNTSETYNKSYMYLDDVLNHCIPILSNAFEECRIYTRLKSTHITLNNVVYVWS